jgi:hypothetical protein
MFSAVLPPHTVIPGRLRAFEQANPESQHGSL